MIIQTLSLYLNDDSPNVVKDIKTYSALLTKLKQLLSTAYAELEHYQDLPELPSIIAETDSEEVDKIRMVYSVVDSESGFLTLSYCDNRNKIIERDLGCIEINELYGYFKKWIELSHEEFVKTEIPQEKIFTRITIFLASCSIFMSILGMFSFMFYDVLIRNENVSNLWKVALIVYIFSVSTLTRLYMTDKSRQQRRIMQLGSVKLVFSTLITAGMLTFGFMSGGINTYHWLTAIHSEREIVFSSKSSSYNSKTCNGSVHVANYQGSLCLDNRSYWMVVKPGMRAMVQGQESTIGFHVESLRLLPPEP